MYEITIQVSDKWVFVCAACPNRVLISIVLNWGKARGLILSYDRRIKFDDGRANPYPCPQNKRYNRRDWLFKIQRREK